MKRKSIWEDAKTGFRKDPDGNWVAYRSNVTADDYEDPAYTWVPNKLAVLAPEAVALLRRVVFALDGDNGYPAVEDANAFLARIDGAK